MLNALSLRRAPHLSDSSSSSQNDDASKARKYPSSFTNRISNYLTRTGYICPVLLLVITTVFIISSVVVNSRDMICVSEISSFDRVSRARYFGLEGVEDDFGALGVPWCRSKHGKTVEWTTKDLLKGLEEFVPIYETRPIKNNMFRMGFDHSFGLWFIARWLKPDLMIESGDFKGHSTWVLRQAMPGTQIISVTPRHPEKYLKKGPACVDGNYTYFAGKDFVDFGKLTGQQ